MKRKAIAMAMAMMMIASAASVCSAASVTDFKDVPSTSWYYNSVKGAVDDGYMNGVTKDTFAPANNLTRAMFATMLARYDKATVDNTAKSAFADVLSNQWYTGSVVWGSNNGIINGYSATKFGTNDFIKREDLALMVYRYVNFKKYTLKEKTPVTFKDANQISAYAKEALEYCRVHGLFIGDQNGYVHPQKLVTRAEAAAVMERIDLVIKESTGGGSSSGGGGGSSTYAKDYTASVSVSKEGFKNGKYYDVPSYDKDLDSKYHVTYRGDSISSSDTLDLVHVAQGFVNKANIEDALKTAGLVDASGNFVGRSYNGQEIISADGTINTVVVKKVKLSEVVSVDDFADDVVNSVEGATFSAQDVKDVINILDDPSNEGTELSSEQKKVVSAIADTIKDKGNDEIVNKVKEKYPDLYNTAEKAGINIADVVNNYRNALEKLAGASVAAYSTEKADSVYGGMAVEVNPYEIAKEKYPKGIDAFIDAYFPNNKYVSKETLKESQGVEALYAAVDPELWAPSGKLIVNDGKVDYAKYQELSEAVVKAADQIRVELFKDKDPEAIKPQLKEMIHNMESRVTGVKYSTDIDTIVDQLAPVVVKGTPTLEDIPASLLNKDITVTVTVSEDDIINNLNTVLNRKDKSYTTGDSSLADNAISRAQGTYTFKVNISKADCVE